jgi:SAM-dependent methyltransferase
VREALTSWLRCPRCRGDGDFELRASVRDEREVRSGTLTCRRCGASYEIFDGIVDLLIEVPEAVRREIAGLERFAEQMRADGWDRERILALPNVDQGYWLDQKHALRRALERTSPRPGARLVDVGSNTCWASNIFARLGLEVVALDIASVDLQGLRSAEHFLASGSVFFERILSTMVDPALADESVDYAFCCQVLHHNRPRELGRTFAALYRILRPGGVLIVASEPMRFPLRPKRHHAAEVAQFEGNEHVYFFHQYWRAARAAGFDVELPAFAPVADALRAGEEEVSPDAGLANLRRALRRHRLGRLLVAAVRLRRFAWRYVLRGDATAALLCTKPAAR